MYKIATHPPSKTKEICTKLLAVCLRFACVSLAFFLRFACVLLAFCLRFGCKALTSRGSWRRERKLFFRTAAVEYKYIHIHTCMYPYIPPGKSLRSARQSARDWDASQTTRDASSDYFFCEAPKSRGSWRRERKLFSGRRL